MTASQRSRVASLYPPGTVLLEPTDDALGWESRARCAEVDGDIFFPEKGGTTREAKTICRGREVRAECLQDALDADLRFGVWGGLSERERRKLRKQRDADQPLPAVEAEKFCLLCRETKPVDEFSKHARASNGYCLACLEDQRQRRLTVSQLEDARQRRAASETVTAIAADLGVSRSYLSDLLEGSRHPVPDQELREAS